MALYGLGLGQGLTFVFAPDVGFVKPSSNILNLRTLDSKLSKPTQRTTV